MIQQQNNVPIDQTQLQGHTGLFNLQRDGVPTGTV